VVSAPRGSVALPAAAGWGGGGGRGGGHGRRGLCVLASGIPGADVDLIFEGNFRENSLFDTPLKHGSLFDIRLKFLSLYNIALGSVTSFCQKFLR
jgi:hypothetical protein